MNSDSTGVIEVISLWTQPWKESLVTFRMQEIIQKNIENKKKTVIFYNRRGSASAWICGDCGFFLKCPNCDIAFSYHSFPRKFLLCHQCNTYENFQNICPNCHGNNFQAVWVGIEQISDAIIKIFSQITVQIFDSDHVSRSESILPLVDKADVILATNLALLLRHERIESIIFALFEVNISVPDYTLEEELYAHISYIKKQKKSLYIQTFSPENPLLQEIIFGNYRSYLQILKNERKQFLYPPFVDFVTIRIHHNKKEIVQNMLLWLVERIEEMDLSDTFFAYDKDIWEKHHGEWMKKIILKGKNVVNILEQLQSSIIRNRNIYVDWH